LLHENNDFIEVSKN